MDNVDEQPVEVARKIIAWLTLRRQDPYWPYSLILLEQQARLA
jgi:hypothetical protein